MKQTVAEKPQATERCTSPQQAYEVLLALEPKPVANTVPDNALEAKRAFIEGDAGRPGHTYSKLAIVDVDTIAKIRETGEYFAHSPSVRDRERPVYTDFVERFEKITHMMSLMNEAREGYEGAAEEFMKLNIELYGEPDPEVYLSLLREKIDGYSDKELTSGYRQLLEEVKEMLPEEVFDTQHEAKRFTPSQETMDWMKQVADSLYGPWLERMPEDKKTYDVQELAELFTQILHEDIGEAAGGWRVDIEPAKAINVKTAEKRIVIPENRGELSRLMVRKLIVHEIGVHAMRSMAGESTDLGPLRTGLDDYYESEEGLGKVMEQALFGKFVEAGVDHYITAGYAYFGNKSFREVYELKWRLAALTSAESGAEMTEQAIEKAKDTAYGATMRIMRGTDSLPWFKDLAYYNGTTEVWKYLEKIRGDEFLLSLLLQGKVNTSSEHRNVVLESHSM